MRAGQRDQRFPFLLRDCDVAWTRFRRLDDEVSELWRTELFPEVAEDLPRGDGAAALRERAFCVEAPFVDLGDLRRAEFARFEAGRDGDEELCCSVPGAFFAESEERREGFEQLRPPRTGGRAWPFWASSNDWASSGVVNDLRLRTPLRSLQSAR